MPPNVEVPPLPSLHLLNIQNVKMLRSERNAELKNEVMMFFLTRTDWFTKYREKLANYRHGMACQPVYPSKRVDRVETLVDELFRASIDPKHVR